MKTLSIATIDARLAEIEAEREALLALRKMYQPESAGAQTQAVRYYKPKFPPREPLVNATGTTPAIFEAVKKQPGIHLGDLIDHVLEAVPSSASRPRKNIANITGQLVKNGWLAKRAEGFYPVE